jgi:hypothetical protein
MGIRRWFPLVVCVLAGCQAEQVEHYQVRKPQVLAKLNPGDPSRRPTEIPADPSGAMGPMGGMPAAAKGPTRVLGAIVPQGDTTWFFKLSGPPEPVAGLDKDFAALIGSLSFADGKPVWELPAGWRQNPGSGMRFATLVPPEAAGELTVIPLPNTASADEALLANINRWRDQLGLLASTAEELAAQRKSGEVRTIDFKGGQAIVVNLVGQASATRQPPFAGKQPPFAGGNVPPVAQPAAPAPFAYKTPEGWQPGRVGGMRKAAFNIASGDSAAEVTAIDLATEAGARLANVNRWREQVGLPAVTAEELKLEQLKTGSGAADYVELFGPGEGAGRKAMLGAILNAGGRVWFFKLQGDAGAAERERDRFRAFVESVKFE